MPLFQSGISKLTNILDPLILEALNSKGTQTKTVKPLSVIPKKKIEVIKKNPEDLIKENSIAKSKLEMFWLLKESSEKDLKERKWKLTEKLHYLESMIRHVNRVELKKLEEVEEIIEARADKNLANIKNKLAEYDRIIYLLQSKYQELKFDKSKLSDRKGEFYQIAKLEPNKDLILYAFVGKNDRPVNCYTLQLIGKSRWGSESYHNIGSEVLRLDRKCMDAVDCFGTSANINKAVKHFCSKQEAESYFKNYGFKGLLRDFFTKFESIKAEYDKIHELYHIKDFNGKIFKSYDESNAW
jgi:hypothetical protein